MNVEITKEFLETCGTASLQGLLLNKGITGPCNIFLRFKQTSYAWRQENGGPELYIMPEFAPYCLLESVLRLVSQGYRFDMEFYT